MFAVLNDAQSRKAAFPISVMVGGIFIDRSPVQPSKAWLDIVVTEDGITVFLHPNTKAFLDVCIIALQPSRDRKSVV